MADYLTTLWPSDDAATVNWGGGARTPILAEWEELIANTDTAWTTRNGVGGVLFTAANGNSLFLPAAGCMEDVPLDTGTICLYWSSSLFTDNLAYSTDSDYAWGFCSDYPGMNHCARSFGIPVRAVFSAR